MEQLAEQVGIPPLLVGIVAANACDTYAVRVQIIKELKAEGALNPITLFVLAWVR
jgi:hypothetical protein